MIGHRAFSREFICITSTMEVLSTTRRSQSSGLSSFLRKPPVLGLISRSRWIVLAQCPVASVNRDVRAFVSKVIVFDKPV